MQVKEYVRLILQKKNMTQQDLVNKMNELHCTKFGGAITKQNVSNLLNGINPISCYMARRIEIALDLPKYELVNIVGFPTTERGMKELEKIEKR